MPCASKKKKIIPVLKYDTGSPVPLHYQLSTGIESYLRKHFCRAGSVLISERALAEKLKLSRNTIRKAYAYLQENEYIERQSGGRNVYVTKKLEDSYVQKSYPTIGLVITDKIGWLVANRKLDVLDYISGVIDTAGDFGFATTIIPLPPVDEPVEKLESWFDSMRSRLSGLVYLGDRSGVYHDKAFQVMLAEKSITQVFIGGKSRFDHLGSIIADAEQGMVMAIEYLLEQQHRDIGLVYTDVPERRYLQTQSYYRYDNALSAMEQCGVKVNPEWVIKGFKNTEYLKRKITHMMQAEKCPSAFMCHNDKVAIEVINICKNLNLKVPEDISVIGYDDHFSAAEHSPSITTVKHPRHSLGKEAVKIIAESHRLRIPVTRLNKTVPTGLIIRGSTGRNKG